MFSLSQSVQSFLGFVLEHTDRIELPFPAPQVNDDITIRGVDLIILAIEPCPYVNLPAIWRDYGKYGDWVYVWREETNLVDWMPLAFIVKCQIEEAA